MMNSSSYELHLGDCTKVIKNFEDNRFDLTVTSPPYDNLRSYKDSLDWGEHVWKELLQELFRTTKQGGVVVWVVGDATVNGSETGTSFRQALFAMDCGFRLHDTMIYAKNSYMPLTHNRYEQAFEYCFVFSKGKPKTFNPIMVDCLTAGTKRNRSGSKAEELTFSERRRDEKTVVNAQKQHCNIFYYDVGKNEKTLHNAPFPEQLALDHVLSWSNEGDVVFDPFTGSGTTGKVSVANGRSFVGVEKVDAYYQISKSRIDAVLRTL